MLNDIFKQFNFSLVDSEIIPPFEMLQTQLEREILQVDARVV